MVIDWTSTGCNLDNVNVIVGWVPVAGMLTLSAVDDCNRSVGLNPDTSGVITISTSFDSLSIPFVTVHST